MLVQVDRKGSSHLSECVDKAKSVDHSKDKCGLQIRVLQDCLDCGNKGEQSQTVGSLN